MSRPAALPHLHEGFRGSHVRSAVGRRFGELLQDIIVVSMDHKHLESGEGEAGGSDLDLLRLLRDVMAPSCSPSGSSPTWFLSAVDRFPRSQYSMTCDIVIKGGKGRFRVHETRI